MADRPVDAQITGAVDLGRLDDLGCNGTDIGSGQIDRERYVEGNIGDDDAEMFAAVSFPPGAVLKFVTL